MNLEYQTENEAQNKNSFVFSKNGMSTEKITGKKRDSPTRFKGIVQFKLIGVERGIIR
jgi:hypothetical protein